MDRDQTVSNDKIICDCMLTDKIVSETDFSCT